MCAGPRSRQVNFCHSSLCLKIQNKCHSTDSKQPSCAEFHAEFPIMKWMQNSLLLCRYCKQAAFRSLQCLAELFTRNYQSRITVKFKKYQGWSCRFSRAPGKTSLPASFCTRFGYERSLSTGAVSLINFCFQTVPLKSKCLVFCS